MKKNRKIARILSMMLVSTMLTGIFPMGILSVGASADGSDWQGKWIWTSDKPSEGQWINLRKTFTLNQVPASAEARISVDSRYWMWINGELVVYEGQLKSGPDQHSWYYDVVDIAPYLQVGENTVAILACYWGHNSASAVATGNQGLLFDAKFSDGALSDGSNRLISDASWKVIKNPAYEVPPVRKNKRPDAVDTKFNASKAIEGWQEVGFDDSAWANATVKTLSATDPRNHLVERSIPQWKVDDIVKYGEEDWTVTGEDSVEFTALSLPESYTVTAEVKSLNSKPVGMLVCVQDAKNFYMPQLQTNKTVKPHVYKDGKYQTTPTLENGASFSNSVNEKMTLTIKVDGTTVTTYVNGANVGSFTDTTLARAGSSVGFRASTTEQVAVYSMNVTDANGNLLWDAKISEAEAGGELTSFEKLSGGGEPVLAEDTAGDTYLMVQNCVISAGTATVDPAATKVYSFYNPTNMQGTPYLKVRSANGGETIHVSSDATAHDGGEAVTHWYVTKAGEQEWEAYNWMSSWRVDFTVPSTVEVLELGWRKSSYNTEHTGNVTTSNEKLNQLYQEAYDTLLITMRDIYMDCPDRERTQWWGDAVLEMQQAAYAMDENARLLYKKLLTQAIGWSEGKGGSLHTTPTNPTFMELPCQCLAGVHSLWQYYLYYGETDILETCYDEFMDYLKLWTLTDRGVLNHRGGTSDWLDWGGKVDASPLEYLWYYEAAKSMLNVAELLEKPQADLDFLQKRVDLMSENFVSMYWDQEIGAYYSKASGDKPDDRVQAMAVYTGLADPAHYPKLLEIIQTTENSSPYMEKYVLEALYMMGYGEEAIERTLKRYDLMLTDEHPTLYEDFDESKLSGNNGTATRNHAWSGGPLSLMYMYSGGILSTGAGFETFRVRPVLGDLTYVSATTKTVSGTITVYATPNALNVTVPQGSTSAEICVPRLQNGTTIKLGGVVVYSNGAVASNLPAGVTYAGEDTGYVNFTVVSGAYEFTMTEDTADSDASHTVTVIAKGNGAVTVNGVAVQGTYTYTGNETLTVVATPANGSRVAYVVGAETEAIYSGSAVTRTYTPDRNMTLQIVFDQPMDIRPSLKVIDATADVGATGAIKGMFYAYRLYINGEEVFMPYYVRESLGLPFITSAQYGEKLTVSVKPVDASNYEVYLTDGNGTQTDEDTLTMTKDVQLKIVVKERDTVEKLPIVAATTNNELPSSSLWQLKHLTDGKRLSTQNISGYASKGFATATPSTPVTITLDLGEAKVVNQVSLFPRTGYESLSGGARCFPKDFVISVSADGNEYTDVLSVTDQADPYMYQQVYQFDDVAARYVKITVTKLGVPDFQVDAKSYYRVQLAEAEVAYVSEFISNDPDNNDKQDPDLDDTNGPTDDVVTEPQDDSADNTADGKKKWGCASSVTASGLATATAIATAAWLSRKRKK